MNQVFNILLHVSGDFQNNVTICDMSNEGKIQCKIPKYDDAPISCMDFHPKTKTLFVVYSNHHIVECCTKTGKYTKLTVTLHENMNLIPREWKTKSYPTKVERVNKSGDNCTLSSDFCK